MAEYEIASAPPASKSRVVEVKSELLTPKVVLNCLPLKTPVDALYVRGLVVGSI